MPLQPDLGISSLGSLLARKRFASADLCSIELHRIADSDACEAAPVCHCRRYVYLADALLSIWHPDQATKLLCVLVPIQNNLSRVPSAMALLILRPYQRVFSDDRPLASSAPPSYPRGDTPCASSMPADHGNFRALSQSCQHSIQRSGSSTAFPGVRTGAS